jgi:hypothetical protein
MVSMMLISLNVNHVLTNVPLVKTTITVKSVLPTEMLFQFVIVKLDSGITMLLNVQLVDIHV